MIIKRITEFRKNMKKLMNLVNDKDETIIISRSNDRDVVLISLRSFNSIKETLYLQSSINNKPRLEKAMKDVEINSDIVKHQLLL